MKRSNQSRVQSPESRVQRRRTGDCGLRTGNSESAFTLLELLVVISILGILAALTVPVLKNFGKADASLSGSRQLLDGVARARQLAVSQRTTVYMVFVPTNFWVDTARNFPGGNDGWWVNLPFDLKTTVTNLADMQLSGYNFVAYGAMGDQPGQHAWHYLDRWQSLPEGNFIAYRKFTLPSLPPDDTLPANSSYRITNELSGEFYDIYGFHTNDTIPFPADKGTNTSPDPSKVKVGINLPYIAFNYLGQLTSDGHTLAARDEAIPLASGSVMAARNPETKAFVLGSPPLPGSPDVLENPPGNSTNLSYSIVHIDRLTGRAVLKFHKMTP